MNPGWYCSLLALPMQTLASASLLSSGLVTSFLPTSVPPTDKARKYLPSTFSWQISILVHSPTFGSWVLPTARWTWNWLLSPRMPCARTIFGNWKQMPKKLVPGVFPSPVSTERLQWVSWRYSVGLKLWMIFHWLPSFGILVNLLLLFGVICCSSVSK